MNVRAVVATFFFPSICLCQSQAFAMTEIHSGEVFRASFDFSDAPPMPTDVRVRFFDVIMTPETPFQTWKFQVYDDPAIKIGPAILQNAEMPLGPFTILMGTGVNSPCCSEFPPELVDQKGFVEISVVGGTLTFASAVAVYEYFEQPGLPEINQPIEFTLVVPEPMACFLTMQLAAVFGVTCRRRRLSLDRMRATRT